MTASTDTDTDASPATRKKSDPQPATPEEIAKDRERIVESMAFGD